jgi:hypothetical protein
MAAWPSQSLAGSLHVEPLVCVVGCPVREPRATLLVPCVWPSSHPNRKRKIGGTGVPVFAVCTSNRTAGAVSGSRRRGPRPADGAMANVRISRRPDQPTVRQPHPTDLSIGGIGEFGELGSGSCSFRDAILYAGVGIQRA